MGSGQGWRAGAPRAKRVSPRARGKRSTWRGFVSLKARRCALPVCRILRCRLKLLGFNVSEKPGKGVGVPGVALHLGPAGGPALHSSVVNCSAIRALTLQTTLQMAVTRRLFRHIDPPRVPGSRYASYRIVRVRQIQDLKQPPFLSVTLAPLS